MLLPNGTCSKLLIFQVRSLGCFYDPNGLFIFAVMEETAIIPVSFTNSAVTEIRNLMAEENFDTSQSLRVGVKGGGCSGMTYILGFDQKTENDQEFEIEGIRCIMNKSHEIYLLGMQVNWLDGLNNRGFTFQNPNEIGRASCRE